ncbi:Transcriptional regulator RutR of pyrimidine catabolism (TetR family) [Klebsiella aerogenes]|nr:Transcriptional regulator RutR of pyrimidine catabolism (TetR family) [Klebsiella aerogenes]
MTPAMLHYYFSSRDALVTQLIEERFMPLRNHISRIFVDHPQDPVLALTMMVETLGHMAEEKRLVRAAVDAGDHRRDADSAPAYGCPASARSVFR